MNEGTPTTKPFAKIHEAMLGATVIDIGWDRSQGGDDLPVITLQHPDTELWYMIHGVRTATGRIVFLPSEWSEDPRGVTFYEQA